MLKRLFDIALCLIALILLAPVMLIIALLVLITMGRPILFRHERPGKNKKTFCLLKFRTMRVGELPDEARVTKLGAFLRKTNLDELPQFLNVLAGSMSIVGPRPLLIRYLPYYTEEENLRFSVQPGITGLAQISGRNVIGWDKRLALDTKYVKTQSLLGDILIIFKTIPYVLIRKDTQCCQSAHSLDLDEERKAG